MCGIPYTLIKVVPVLGQRGQVDDTEEAAMIGPTVGIVWGGLTQVVKSRPYELSHIPVIVIGQGKVHIGQIAPEACFGIVSAALVVVVLMALLQLYGKFINTSAAYGTCCLTAQDEALGKTLVSLWDKFGTVIETGDIQQGTEAVPDGGVDTIHTGGHRACGVQSVTDVS